MRAAAFRRAILLFVVLLSWSDAGAAAASEPWIDGCIKQIEQTAAMLAKLDPRFDLSPEAEDEAATLTILPNGLRYMAGSKQHYYSIEILQQRSKRSTWWHRIWNRRRNWFTQLSRSGSNVYVQITANVESVSEDDGDMGDRRSIFLPAARSVANACLRLASAGSADGTPDRFGLE